ncbi:MAG: signal peptidase I [Marmoricola sp.]
MISPTVRTNAQRAARAFVVVTAGLGIASLLFAAVLIVAGARPMIFRSGSMSPTIPTGSMGFTRSVPASDVRVGDVVTVKVDGARVTHRVIALDRHGDVALLELKGDGNRAADRTIYPVRDVPRTWFSVPFAGSFVQWLGSPVGGLALAAYLLFAFAVIDGWTRRSLRRAVPAGLGIGPVQTRVLAAATATLTLVGAGFGGWVMPTWATWADTVDVAGPTISTGTWDVAAPISAVTNATPAANAAGWYKANITVTLGASDPAPSSGVAGIHYKLNNGTEQVISGASGTVVISTEGTNTLEFWAVDNAGFVESPHNSIVYKLDKTPPPAPVFTAISNDTGTSSTDRITSGTTQTLTGTAEANSSVTVKQGSTVLGNATTSGSGTFTFGPVTLTAGTNTFTATATDIADNTGPASAGFDVVLDDVAPNSVTISPNDSAWHNSGAWTVTASDALSGVVSVSARVGAGSFVSSVATNGVAVPQSALSDGVNTVQAYATDRAGVSSSAAPATATIKVDTVKPTASLTLAPVANAPWRLSGSATVSGTDAGGAAASGVEHVEYKIDSGAFISSTSGTASVGLVIPDGVHTITYRAVDFAGNVTADASQSVSIDSVAPSTTAAVSAAPNAAGWNKVAPTVTFTPSDATSTVANVKYRTTLNGGTPSVFTTLTGPYATAAITGQGTTLVEFQATDVAGNVESLKSISVKVDTGLPTATLTFSGNAGNSPWFLTGTAKIDGLDTISGVDHVEYQVDGAGAVFTATSGVNFTIPDGTHTITYWAVDVAGNAGTGVVSSSFKIDSVAPSLTNPLPADGSTGTSWSALDCSARTNQLCVNATDATSGLVVASPVQVQLLRTSGTTQCWNGPTASFVNGTACAANQMTSTTGSQFATTTVTAAQMTAGTYKATYTAKDVAGNTATLVTTFTIAAAPVITACSRDTGSGDITVTWTGVVGATSYSLKLSNPSSTITNVTSPYTTTTLAKNSTGTVIVTAVLPSGSTDSVAWTYDGTGANQKCHS